jgi:hypothetical protein
MGIERTGKALPELENKRFRAMAHAKCDWRVNFSGMRGNVGLRRDTSMWETPGSGLSVVGLRSGHNRARRIGLQASGHRLANVQWELRRLI